MNINNLKLINISTYGLLKINIVFEVFFDCKKHNFKQKTLENVYYLHAKSCFFSSRLVNFNFQILFELSCLKMTSKSHR